MAKLSDMSDFKDKVVVVTGACGGIGVPTVKIFAQGQASLVLVDLDGDGLKTTAELCRKEGSNNVLTIKADLAIQEDLQSIVDNTLDHFKKIDVLVNNAGISFQQSVAETTWEDYDKTMNVNLKAPYFLTKSFLPELIKTKGTIVNTSSTAGKLPGAIYASYCVSKAGLNHFTRIVAQDNAVFGVRCNSVCPGIADTRIAGTDEKPTLMRLVAKPTQPLCGLIDPAKIGAWIVFLASEESGPITGQNVSVDGGCEVTRIPTDYKVRSSI